MKKLFDDVWGILKAPFVGQLDLMSLFLVTGVVIISASLWFIMIHHMRHLASEVEV